MMKLRILTLTLALALLFSLSACTPTRESESGTVITNAMDLTAEWNKVADDDSLVQGCVVVRNEFLKENPEAVERFLDAYQASINYLSTNLDDAAQMIVDAGIFESAPVAKKAIPKCNVRFVDGDALKSSMNTYLSVLYSINAASIGGALPADDFYYARQSLDTSESAPESIRIYTLNGTTGFGMAKLIADARAGSTYDSYTFTVQSDPSVVTSALTGGDADIVALPTNAAANLYNKTGGKVTVLAVNTLGCLYLLTNQNETVTSFEDLRGKTVYTPKQNPSFIFKYLCEQNGLVVGKDVFIDSTSYAEPANLKTAVAAGKVDIAVLPEPMVTVAINAANAAAQK